MNTLWHDARHSLRLMTKSKGATLIAVATLGLGIGACTAIFSVVDGILLRPLAYPNPEQIVQVWQIGRQNNRMRTSDPNFEEWRDWSSSFQAIAQFTSTSVSVAGGSEPVRMRVGVVSRDFFSVVGVSPQVGRAFLKEEYQPGAASAVIVSYGYWQRYLGGEPGLSKHTLSFANKVFSVVGVMPEGFSFPPGIELWVPRGLFPRFPSRTAHNWAVYARLKSGVPLAQAQAEMTAIGKRQLAQYGDDIWLTDVAVVPLHEQLTAHVRPALLILLGAVVFLLLVACANVVNLLLSQVAARQRELAVRVALGAGRGRLVRQFLTESLMLSLAGGALGVLLAYWGVKVLPKLDPGYLPRLAEVALDWRVLGFALGVSVLAAVALGTIAAWRAANRELHESLKEGGRSQMSGAASQRVRGGLVALQMALTMVLLIGAGLLARSFLLVLGRDPGFRRENILAIDLSSPSPRDDSDEARLVRFHDELMARLRSLPGVQEVGGVNAFPLSGGAGDGAFLIVNSGEVVTLETFGRLVKDPNRIGYAEFRVASDGYFRAMNIPLLRGRLFDERDGSEAPHVAVISESLAKTRWPNEDPLGKLIQFGNMDGNMRVFTIVGIVSDIREYGLHTEPRPTFYGNYRQRPAATSSFSIVLYGTAEPASAFTAARTILHELAPDVPPRFRTVQEAFARSLADRRFSLLLFGVFGGIALLLAVMGIYGVMAYAVTQRTQEIGVRMALGATPANVLGLIVRNGMALAGIGLAAGLLAALGLTRLMAALLFGIKPTDPVTFAAIAALLAVVALAACYIPARRAARVDPLVALRYE